MVTDSELLRRYAEAGAEEAFTELVRRHLDLVYSAALRQVNGDTHLAQDVAQTVFADLARKASALARRPVLTGWLYTSTHFAAAKSIRTESRRRAREEEAQTMHALLQTSAPDPDWSELGPALDQAMHQLDEAEREVLLLRFFENRRFAEVGERLGLTEEAARKRTERSLEKLRDLLLKRGLATPASLGAVIAANAVHAAPAGLAATLSTSILACTASTAPAAGATLAQTIAMTTLQKTLVTALVAALAGTALYEARQASAWRGQVSVLEQQQAALSNQLEQVAAGSRDLSNQLARADTGPSLTSQRLRELLRLRGEAGLLRRRQRELEQTLAAAQLAQPHTAAASASNSTPAGSLPFQVQLVADGPGDNTETKSRAAGSQEETLHLDKTPLMDYTAIRAATVAKNETSGEAEINIEFSPEGKDLFAAVTKENLNKRLAIVLNGQVYAAPVIRSEISSGKAQITGHFTEEEANQLAAKINEAIRGQ